MKKLVYEGLNSQNLADLDDEERTRTEEEMCSLYAENSKKKNSRKSLIINSFVPNTSRDLEEDEDDDEPETKSEGEPEGDQNLTREARSPNQDEDTIVLGPADNQRTITHKTPIPANPRLKLLQQDEEEERDDTGELMRDTLSPPHVGPSPSDDKENGKYPGFSWTFRELYRDRTFLPKISFPL